MNHRVNHQIRIPSIKVIDSDGKMLGVMSNSEALGIAQNKGLDLVEIDPNQRPPICKIMDYGKFKYDQGKREKEARKASKSLPVKEVQFSPNVEDNDIAIKTRQIREFIGDGHKVRITMRFRGRDLQHVDLGRSKFENIVTDLNDISKVEQKTDFNGNTLAVMIGRK